MDRLRLLVLALVVALVVLLPLVGASGGQAQDAATPAASPASEATAGGWTNFKGDAGRRGVADAGPTGQPVERWRVRAGGPCNPPPAAVAGVVYAPCGDGILYVLDAATGAERWRFTGAGPLGDATVAGGLVYVNDADVLRALDVATGQERWHAAVPGGTGAVVEDGLLVIGTGDGFLLGLDAMTGTERWRFRVSTHGSAHNPALGDGIAYAGGDDPGFFAVDAASGTLRWRGDTGDDRTGTAVVADGIAYLGGSPDSGGGHLYAFDARTGALLWRRDEPIFTPAVLDGVGYAGSVAGVVSAFDTATGNERWRVQLGGVVRPVAVAPGIVYAPSDGDRALYALDAATGRQLWSFALDGGIDGSLAVDGGVAYVATTFGSIYAIGGTGEGEAATPAAGAAPGGTPADGTAPPTGSPAAAAGPVELIWQSTGGSAPFSRPRGLTIDPEGNLWVADANSQFQIFAQDGTYLETWGTAGSGEGQFNLVLPSGDTYGVVAFGPDGAFYVADPGNHRVQTFDQARNFVAAWAGQETGDGQELGFLGVAVDARGLVYLLDGRRDEVQVFDGAGASVRSFRIHAAFGLTSEEAEQSTNFVAVDDAGNVYVTSALRQAVLKFDPNGKLAAEIGGPGIGDGQFAQPADVAIDAAGNLFVTDFGTGRVEVFAPDGTFLMTWGAFGDGPGQFLAPAGIAVRGQNVFVADFDGNRVQAFKLRSPLAPTDGTPTP